MSIEHVSTHKSDTTYDISALSATEQRLAQPLLGLLDRDIAQSHSSEKTRSLATSIISIKAFVDGQGLACPMPLLKTKVALRQLANDDSLYIVATDPNSQADIMAFCEQSQMTNAASALSLSINTVTSLSDKREADSNLATSFDTIYHFIITKTDSN